MRLLLADLAGIFRRYYHATQHEERGEAMRRTLRQIRTLAPEYDRVVICKDSRTSWRKDLDETYKAQRDKPDELLFEEMRATTEALGRDGFHVVEAEGFEADDVIASLCVHLGGEGREVDVLSADKDMCQLVDDSAPVAVVKPDGARFDAAAVEAKFGVPPRAMPEWQALVGDASDNIPGVRCIGAKRATALLTEHGTLRCVVAAAHDDQIKGAAATNIKAADASKKLARWLKLVTLRDDALTEEQARECLEVKAVQTETEADFEEADMGQDISEQLAAVEAVPEPEPSQPAESGPGLSGAMVPYQEPQTGALWARGLEPRNMGEAKQLAKYVLDSRLFASYGTPQAALLVIMSGRELGIGAMSALRSFHIVEGKPTMSAQLIKGLCQSSPSCEYFALIDASSKSATFETKRKGEPQPTRITYSIEDADAAGLLGKKNWRSYPRQMLMNRCIAELGRMVYPDVVANLYTPDELGADVPEEVAA